MRAIARPLLGFVFACGVGVSVNAADLPAAYKAPPPAAAPYNWTGFYIGGNLGYGWAHADATANIAGTITSGSENLNGVLGGGQLGFNWQTGNWVFGLETDVQGTGQRISTSATVAGVTATETDSIPWFGTTRARAGFAQGSWLFYATGGVGYGEFKSILALSGAVTGSASTSETRAGWVAGGGIEAAINNSRWSWKVEYLHFDSGTISSNTTIAGVPVAMSARVTDEIVRGGLNYRF